MGGAVKFFQKKLNNKHRNDATDKQEALASIDLLPDSQKWGIYKLLPPALLPYAQLARWDRPIGWQLLMWPCWWAFMLACLSFSGHQSFLPFFLHSCWYLFLFFLGSVVMRGAGCTWNDLMDQDIDSQVDRTQKRPLPSGRVSQKQAIFFMIAQALVGLCILLQFNRYTILLGLSSLIFVAAYPFMKRITYWPQLFLGIVFNWGILLGWTAQTGSLSFAPVILYLGTIAWTIAYDTIYAHQDREDDIQLGIGSTALLFGAQSRKIIAVFFAAFLICTLIAFCLTPVGFFGYLGLLGAFLLVIFQLVTLDIDDSARCLYLFKCNSLVGLVLFLGLLLDNFSSYL